MTNEEYETWTGGLEFPQNLTLYADQFTERGAETVKEREGYHAVNLEKVFAHFKPSKSALLRNEAGELVEETFSFNAIEDFEDEQMIAQSSILVVVTRKIEAYNRIARQLERNKALRGTLEDGSRRKCLKNVLETLLAELKGEQHPQGQENLAGNLAQCGGFQLLKGIVLGIENMDPERKAMRAVFLSDNACRDERQRLEVELGLWTALLANEGAAPQELVKTCVSLCVDAEQSLQSNLAVLHDETRQLEVAYRTLEAFFDNAGEGDIDCLTLMNLKKDDFVSDEVENMTFIEHELKRHYDALSLKNSYSLLVVPGYLGDAASIRKWANLAYRNKVILVTDFKDCQSFKMLKEELEDAHLQASDVQLSNAIMTCNYLLARRKSELSDEDDDVYMPGSGALAGCMSNTRETSIAQGVVGRDHGFLNNVKGVRLDLLKSEIAVLIAQGVIPLAEDNGQTFALSNRSLYNGASASLQEYPIVRVLDWVNKVLMNYMHDIALETWDTYVSPQKLENKIRDFLDHYRGYQLLFSNYKLAQPSQDPVTKIVTVDVSVTPFYATKNLIIKLEADNKDYLNADTSVE